MSHKTFISYKYNEAKELRDRIIRAMGNDATYYRGETSYSPDLTDYSTYTIKNTLKDMIFNTSVTIVILSPRMQESEWMDWEIEYSLKAFSRDGRTSRTNGVICVIQKVNGSYDWLRTKVWTTDNYSYYTYENDKLFPIIYNNRFNQSPQVFANERYHTIGEFEGNYISIVDEETFLSNVNWYVENAYGKSKKSHAYDLCKDRKQPRHR